MTVLPGAIMVLAGAVCFGGALVARRWLGIAASAVMLLAMMDLTLTRIVPAIVWAALLLLAGMLIGFGLRNEVGSCAATPAHRETEAPRWLSRGIATAAAVAYPVMAWLVLLHSSAPVGDTVTAIGDGGAHAGHGSAMAGTAVWAVSFGLTAILTVFLTVLAVQALRRREWLLGAEGIGMAAMLAAMLFPH